MMRSFSRRIRCAISSNGASAEVVERAEREPLVPADRLRLPVLRLLENLLGILLAGGLDAWILLSLLAAPLALPVRKAVRTRTDGPSLNAALAGTGRLLAVFSILLAAGVLAS